MSSIFGQSKQPASTSSLFGNVTSSQPQQSSIFSNLGGEQKPNPFPSLVTTSVSGAGSIFGTAPPATSQPTQTSSLFGIQNNATTSQPLGSSLFAPKQTQIQNNQQAQKGQEQQQQQDGHQASSTSKASHAAYFDSLLEKGRKRTHDADGGPGFRDLPSLQLGLGDIAKRVKELGGTGAQTEGARVPDSRASAYHLPVLGSLKSLIIYYRHYLLAASGVNPGTTRRDLDSLAVQPPFSGGVQQPTDWDPDTHKYVEQLQQQSTLKMISEGLERAQRNFDAYLEENVDINWELQRKKIYEHFGLTARNGDALEDSTDSPGVKGSFGKSTRKGHLANKSSAVQATMNRSIFGQSRLQKSVIGPPGVGSGKATLFADVAEKNGSVPVVQDDRFLRERQRRFAEKVQTLNRARLGENSYPVLQEFKSVESQPGGEVSQSNYPEPSYN